MSTDKEIQLAILEELRAAYPGTVDFHSRTEYTAPEVQANLFYLKERGYITGAESKTLASTRLIWASITTAGIDFLKGAAAREGIRQGDERKPIPHLLSKGWVVIIGAGLILFVLAQWLW